MNLLEFLKWLFEFAMSGFWKFVGVAIILGLIIKGIAFFLVAIIGIFKK